MQASRHARSRSRSRRRCDTSARRTAAARRRCAPTRVQRSSSSQVEAKDDREAARAADALDALARAARGGSLSHRAVLRSRRIASRVDDRARRRRARAATIAHTGEFGAVARAPPPANQKPPRPLITWDHIISPEEWRSSIAQARRVSRSARLPAGRSYRGRDISVMEITLPAPGELVSLAKLDALKPTIFITGRQHANEVSSTSHILRLAELLVDRPGVSQPPKKVNVVLHPVENPDGARWPTSCRS